MKRILAVLVLAAGCVAAQKKPKPVPPPPVTYPTSRVLPASCDAVWPVALRVVFAAGWGVKTSDRAGGLLMLERTRNDERLRSIDAFVVKYTTAQATGFWHSWSDFRISSAQVIASPQDGGCSYSITVVYDGFGKLAAYDSMEWRHLPSNGSAENALLNQIQEALPK